MEIMKSILAFAGGLGMFIYGMHLLAEGLQQAAGSRARKLMAFLTGNRLAAVFTGAAVTALIQSSSAATVMVVGFVNASVMTLQQAVGVIMGANIGTTMTGWIVSMGEWSAFLKPSMIAPAFLFAGTVCLLTAKKEQLKHGAHILIGFGILFMGLDSMSGAIAPYTDEPVFADAFRLLGSNPIYGLLTGAVVTAIIQSSSASMGILQTLAMAGVVNWGAAAFIALGQNIGTCATVIGLCLWVFFLFNPAIAQSNVTGTELAVFHTSFNVLCTIMLFPFAGWLVKLSGQLVPAAGKTKKGAFVRLDPRMGEAPALALEAIESQIYAMSKIAQEAVKESAESPEKVLEDRQKSVEEMRQDITEALQGLNTSVMSQGEHQRSERDMMSLTDISRIIELSVQVAAIRGKADGDCESCQEGLKKLARSAARTLKLARHERVDEALEQEEAVDALEKELRQQVLDQMDAGTMKASHAVACLDCIRRYERISDHAEMLARNHEIQ